MEVLYALSPLFRAGSIIVFDELVNYPGFMNGELLALFDFLKAFPRPFRVVYAPWNIAADRDALLTCESAGACGLRKNVAIELLA